MNMAINSIVPALADTCDIAAFPSVDAALRFAFGNRHRGCPDSLAQHQTHSGSRGPARFDDADERAAWAGAIRRRVGTLHPAVVALLTVRFAPRAIPCACRRPCCSGWSRNQEWSDALSVLVSDSVTAVSGQISNRHLRAGVIKRWAGVERTNIGILAEKCGVHRDTAGKQAKAIRRWLDVLERRALDEADLCLTLTRA